MENEIKFEDCIAPISEMAFLEVLSVSLTLRSFIRRGIWTNLENEVGTQVRALVLTTGYYDA